MHLTFAQLRERPAIRIVENITDYTVDRTVEAITKLPATTTKLVVYVSSNGGGVENGLGLHDLIRLTHESGIDVVMLATGKCHSTATWLMTAVPVENRYATRHARFLVHPVSIEIASQTMELKPTRPDFYKPEDTHAPRIAEAYTLQETMRELFIKHTELLDTDLDRLFTGDNYFGASQARAYGLIGHVL